MDEAQGAPAAAPPAVKSGWKTTEFWLSLAAKIVGLLLTTGILGDGSKEARIAGMAAMVLTSLGYTVSRGTAKAAKILLVAIALPLLLGACCKGHISADAVAPLIEDVSGRHDRFVNGQPSAQDADPANRASYLRSTELLRKAVKEAKSP